MFGNKGMKQTSQTKAKEICQHILKAYPNKSLEEFLDMVEYPAFMAKIPPIDAKTLDAVLLKLFICLADFLAALSA